MSADVIQEWRAVAADVGAQPAWFSEHQRRALDAFAELGFPSRRDEAWKYTDVRALGSAARSLKAPAGDVARARALVERVTPAQCAARVVLVNGAVSTELSTLDALPEGVRVTPLAEALDAGRAVLEPLLERFASTYDEGFAALTQALARGGALLEVARDTEVDLPIAIVSVATGVGTWFEPSMLVVAAERHARVRIVEAWVGDAEADVLRCPHTLLRLDAGARVDLVKVQCEGAATSHVARTWAQLDRDAHLAHFQFTLGAALSRDDTRVMVDAAGAHCDLSALFVARGAQTADHHTTIDHRVPDTTSHQLYKGVFDDRGHGVFNGRVFVRQDAQHTNAEQLNNNLLLSPNARIDTKPQLEIFADDVKCSHGATIGQLSADELFYLASRAIGPERARALLIRGFAHDALEQVGDNEIRSVLSNLFDDSFGARG